MFFLGPLSFDSETGEYRAPAGVTGMIDLSASGMPGSLALMESKADLGPAYAAMGDDWRTLPRNARAAWNSICGMSVAGASLIDLLANTLTQAADPDGAAICRPLMPTHQGTMEIHLGGLQRSWSFAGESDPAWPRVQATVQRAVRELSLRSTELAGRYVEAMRRKCRVAPERLIPVDVRDVTARTPTTSISDAFTDSDGTLLPSHVTGGGWSWVDLVEAWRVQTNRAESTSASNLQCSTRAEVNLSSSDMLVSVEVPVLSVNSNRCGEARARYASGANTTYGARLFATGAGAVTGVDIVKIEAGVITTIRAIDAVTLAGANKVSCKADGSTISGYYNDVLTGSVTDTAITSGVRAGMGLKGTRGTGTSWVALDNFAAADLIVASGVRRRRLICAGVG